MNVRRSISVTAALAALATLGTLAMTGCGSKPPPAAAVAKAPVADDDHEESSGGPSVESEVGALNEDKVKTAFEHASGKLTSCFNKGAERLPYLSGEVRFVIRVKKDGTARWAFVKDSNLGDRSTEECMLNALKGLSWPKPKGGEGIAENSFTFAPGEDDRPPIDWSPERLGKPFHKAQGALSKCRAEGGGSALKATMYVDTDGKATAIGVSSAEEKGAAAIGCVISTLQGITFPSPGSYAAKVTVPIE
jgi:hypothetical protein